MGNRATASEAASFVDAYEMAKKDFDSEYGALMKKFKDKTNEILEDAKSQGVAKKTVKALVGVRFRDRKNKEVFAEFDSEELDYAVDIFKALGGFVDSPLGRAAVEREEGPAGGQDPATAAIVAAAKDWD